MTKVLVTGGVRSGKSAHAEQLLGDRTDVTYVATGPQPGPDDPEWAARVLAHQQRRPASWTTIEYADLATAIPPTGATLVDCLGNWVTSQLDELGAWVGADWEEPFEKRLVAFAEAVAATDEIVLVTNEVGLGVIPEHASGRLFRDLLGQTNQRIAAVCDEVHLVVAGRVLVL